VSDTVKKPTAKKSTPKETSSVNKETPDQGAPEQEASSVKAEKTTVTNETSKTSDKKTPKMTDEDRLKEANAIVTRNIYWALGLGVIPLPLVDMVAIAALQVKMIRELSELYGVPFSNNIAATSVMTLIGGIAPVELSKGLSSSIIKLIPGIGTAASTVALPVTAGATTYAIGHIFILHFESDGNFFDFDTSKVKQYSQDLFAKGKKLVTGLWSKDKDKAETDTKTETKAETKAA